jgi:WhiB family redox-sensing transcriptional regulator
MTDLRATSLTRPTGRLSTREPAEWRLDAACRGWDHALRGDPWHPASEHPTAYDQARRVCGTCRVATSCLDEALAAESRSPGALRFGMYGGRTPSERATSSLLADDRLPADDDDTPAETAHGMERTGPSAA